jgi:hypothetical protein
MSKFILKKNEIENIENIIPLFPQQIYQNPQKYQLSPSLIDSEVVNPKDSVICYIQNVDAIWNSIVNDNQSKLHFCGGIPIAMGLDNNFIFKSSAFFKLILHQTEYQFKDSRWLTEEQIHQYQLDLKDDSHPVLVLWRKIISLDEYELVYTRLFNIEDIIKFHLPNELTFPVEQINWDYRLSELIEEYGIECVRKTNIVSQDGKIYRNEAFLHGTNEQYRLYMPYLTDSNDFVTLQQYLIALSILIFRTKSGCKDIKLANQFGYFFGSVLVNQIMPKPEYKGSIFHKLETNIQVSELIYFVDEYINLITKYIFEVGLFFSNTLILEKGFRHWLLSEAERSKLKNKMQISSSLTQSDPEETINRIRRNNFDSRIIFLEDLNLRLKQEAIHVLNELPIYSNAIQNQVQRVITERDLELYPDEYDFYILIKEPLLRVIVERLKIAEDLKVSWTDFENQVLNSNLLEPAKETIIKNKACEYKKFFNDILFSNAVPEIIYEESKKILKFN